ncbi:hypothetical protein J3R03_002359 [Actinoplanes couchii]|nr:hypothetical protein [Actinoplanes couchii]
MPGLWTCFSVSGPACLSPASTFTGRIYGIRSREARRRLVEAADTRP